MKNAAATSSGKPPEHFFVVTPDGKQLNENPVPLENVLLTVVRYEANINPVSDIVKRYDGHVAVPSKKEDVKTFEPPDDTFVKCDRCSVDNIPMWVKPASSLALITKRGYKLQSPPEDFEQKPKKKVKGVKNHEIEKYIREKKKRMASGIELDKEFTQKLDAMLKEYKRITGRDYV